MRQKKRSLHELPNTEMVNIEDKHDPYIWLTCTLKGTQTTFLGSQYNQHAIKIKFRCSQLTVPWCWILGIKQDTNLQPCIGPQIKKKILLPKSRNYLQKQQTIGNKFYPTSKKMKNLIEIKREKNSRNLTKRPPQRKLLLKNHRAEFDTV